MKFFKTIFLLLFTFIFLSSPAFAISNDSIFVWSQEDCITQNNTNSTILNNHLQNVSTIPSPNTNSIENQTISTSASTISQPQIQSDSAILIEQTSGKILFEKNSHEQLRPASVTKIMTILLVMEAIDSGKISLTDNISCSENASSMGGSQIWLDPKETLTVDEMLKAICVVSANDCTVAMAEHLAGSQEAFVELMNSRAKELGMNDTCFKNCHGLDEDGHITSSYDISLMSRELLNNHPLITNYTTIWMDSLRDGTSELVNTNKLIRNYNGATGLKTGSTSLALYNLSASATRSDLSLVAVIMHSPSSAIRFEDATNLLNYGFSNYTFKSFGKKGDTIKNINVSKGIFNSVDGILENNSGALILKKDEINVEQTYIIPEIISAPVFKGEKLGELTFSLNGETIASVNVVAKNDINKLGFWSTSSYLLENWFKCLR